MAHEPPLLSLLDTTAKTKPIAEEERRKLGEVRERLETGDHAEAAEYFVERVALGPGTWPLIPAEMQQMFIGNASTFLGELRDPDALTADVVALAEVSAPVLLTQGDQSPAFFAPIIDLLSGILPDARRHTIKGAGHVPHVTHPDDYASVIRKFLVDA